MMMSVLTLAAPSLTTSVSAPVFPVNANYENYHMVRGQRRHGLLIDTGAALALMGTETLRQLVMMSLRPANQRFSIAPSSNKFTGIEGAPEPS